MRVCAGLIVVVVDAFDIVAMAAESSGVSGGGARGEAERGEPCAFGGCVCVRWSGTFVAAVCRRGGWVGSGDGVLVGDIWVLGGGGGENGGGRWGKGV